MVEGAALEMLCGATHRGFESHSLRILSFLRSTIKAQNHDKYTVLDARQGFIKTHKLSQ